MLSWIPDLNLILKAVSASLLSLIYTVLLLFLFLYHYALAGVLLFAKNDVFHFGSVIRALATLLQITAFDNWNSIARTNMMGCEYFGYNTGMASFDGLCDLNHSRGLGWFAYFYFLVFVVVSVMVLLSLVTGLIITAMDMLKDGVKNEKIILLKVAEAQTKYNISNASISILLEVFDKIDNGSNGKLTVSYMFNMCHE